MPPRASEPLPDCRLRRAWHLRRRPARSAGLASAALRPPEGFDGAAGALLEPLGVAVHAFDLGHVHLGDDVAVIGCGPIGLLLIQVLRAAGARSILAVEPLTHRRVAAERAGADTALAPQELEADHARAVDVAFEVAGTEDDAVDAAIHVARPGARVVLVGIPSGDHTTFTASVARRKGLTLVLVRRMNDIYARAVALVEQGRVDLDWLVSERYPLARVGDAFHGGRRSNGPQGDRRARRVTADRGAVDETGPIRPGATGANARACRPVPASGNPPRFRVPDQWWCRP